MYARNVFNFYRFKTVFLLYVGIFFVVNLGNKHIIRTDIKLCIAVKCSVNNISLSGFAVYCRILDKVIISFEMTVYFLGFHTDTPFY